MNDAATNPYGPRAESLKARSAELVADVRLYATAEGGRQLPAPPGWGCPCIVDAAEAQAGFDGWPLLDTPLLPGEQRPGVGFVFLSPEAAQALARAGRFQLWEGRIIGEARVVAREKFR